MKPSKISVAREEEAPSGERGFTLVETTIAMLIMMIASVGIAGLFLYSQKYNTGANDRTLAMAVAQKRMEWLRNITFNSTTRVQAYAYPGGGLGATNANGVDEATTSAGRSYTVTTIIENVGGVTDANSTRKTITIQVTPVGTTSAAIGRVRLITQRSTLDMGTN